MIFYTTGTGNTKYVAGQLSHILGEKTTLIDHNLLSQSEINIELAQGERLIFVQPVHSWGPALLSVRFIRKASFANAEAWAVMVCGDNCGNSDHILRRKLGKKGVALLGTFSVQMPNNYILMKGFGVDSIELQQQKIAAAPERIKAVAEAITNNEPQSALYERGSLAWLKSGLVYPSFAKFAHKQVKFYSTPSCNGCALCAQLCPTHNITIVGDKPTWGNSCVQCTACINRCPRRGIECKASVDQGRYFFKSSK